MVLAVVLLFVVVAGDSVVAGVYVVIDGVVLRVLLQFPIMRLVVLVTVLLLLLAVMVLSLVLSFDGVAVVGGVGVDRGVMTGVFVVEGVVGVAAFACLVVDIGDVDDLVVVSVIGVVDVVVGVSVVVV